MRSLIPLCLLLAQPVFACPMPPPAVEVIANPTATIAPDGGLIVRIQRGGGERNEPLAIRADGAATEVERIYIAFDLSVLRPKRRAKTLEVTRGDKVIHSLPVAAASPPLPAPKLVRVRSTAPQLTNKPVRVQMYAPTSQVTLELGSDTPADAYALVFYKLAPEGTRGIGYGTPDPKHTIVYQTGGKMCSGGFETAYPGEKIAVAWLDIHGRLSARSATITVAAATP